MKFETAKEKFLEARKATNLAKVEKKNRLKPTIQNIKKSYLNFIKTW